MPAFAAPSSVREQALNVIARRLGFMPSTELGLAGLGNVNAVQLLLDLEEHFGVLIDVDEVLPAGTVGTLAAICTLRMCGRPPAPEQPFTLIDLAAARADRDRRTQAALGIPEPPDLITECPPCQMFATPAEAEPADDGAALRRRAHRTFGREAEARRFFGVMALVSIGAGFLCALIVFAFGPR